MSQASLAQTLTTPAERAAILVAARQKGGDLMAYPEPIPATLAEAYACQEAAIDLWPDAVAGWKIGGIPADRAALLGADRLTGPVFRKNIWRSESGHTMTCPAFRGGFAAVEGEIVVQIAEDAPTAKTEWSVAEARAMAANLYCGIEIAGSPIANINARGTTVVVSDFGNNTGLIVGAAIPDWQNLSPEDLGCATAIDGGQVGRVDRVDLNGGTFEALRFLLGQAAGRNRPLKKGMMITTGALTGIHEIGAGQRGKVVFSLKNQVFSTIDCVMQQI
ncbi:MAG: 2-keto-4-pentenoate hydratase [Alphaproteobacteria bacterium]|nr:2-keto-4-pentenoate hydratase [Alphaproteobacteria bacterium]MBV8548362.1 2-keto-4-pentenoate hydratase [Alphaproteobacteria bacterium]